MTLSADRNPDEPQWAVVSGVPGAPTVTIPRPWSPRIALTQLGNRRHAVKRSEVAHAIRTDLGLLEAASLHLDVQAEQRSEIVDKP